MNRWGSTLHQVDVLDRGNRSRDFWADRGYHDRPREGWLRLIGWRVGLQALPPVQEPVRPNWTGHQAAGCGQALSAAASISTSSRRRPWSMHWPAVRQYWLLVTSR
ncbi:hypothetical protein D3C78_1749070 [compost metagenome]